MTRRLHKIVSLMALGVLLSVALAWSSRPAAAGEGVALWVADRGANALFGLDDDLFFSRRIELRAPVALARAPEGGVWVLSATEGTPLGAHRLLRVDAEGVPQVDAHFGQVLDLGSLDGRDALVIERGPATELVRVVGQDGDMRTIFERTGLTCVVGRGERVLVGTADGELVLLDASSGVPLAFHSLGSEIGDIAPAPRGWWVLDVSGAGHLALFDEDLNLSWLAATHAQALHLTPEPGRESVWLASSTQPSVRRFGPGGVLELTQDELPLSDLDRGLAWRGGVLLLSPGGILRLNRRGRIQPAQGGFTFAVAVERAR
jgi:hypothetical protein